MKKRKPNHWGDCEYCEHWYDNEESWKCEECEHYHDEIVDYWTPRKCKEKKQ